MRMVRWLGTTALTAVVACGCSSMNNTEKGVGVGAALGAGTGALLGAATHNAAAGAAIGAGVGAVAGGVVGHDVDQQEKQKQAQLAAAQAAQAKMLTLPDVAQMTQQHIADPIIINQIHATHSVYALTANDIQWLKSSGVSDAVILEMQATANQPVVVAPARRVYVAQPGYVYDPPPPPVAVGLGVGVRVH
jgi:outer membrane lipoprotein SlyB